MRKITFLLFFLIYQFSVLADDIKVKIRKPIELIKNHTAGISPSIEPIIF